MRQRWFELIGAVMLLTRLPVGRLWRPVAPGACVWAYPLVGIVVALPGAGLLRLWHSPLAAVWAVALTVLLTGGLHEDGLADTADGIGGGATRERKLLIMRDSRIGSYGAIALALTLMIRVGGLALAADPARALLVTAVLGRAAMLPLLLLRPARADGLGAALAGSPRRGIAAGAAIGLATAWVEPGAVLAAAAVALAMPALARGQLGGFTGDVMGATEQIAEAAALSAMAG